MNPTCQSSALFLCNGSSLRRPLPKLLPGRRINLTKETKTSTVETSEQTERRNQRRFQKMEITLMLMDWDNWYCWYGYTTKSNPQVQQSSHQNASGIPHRNREEILKLHIQHKNPEEPKWT